MSAITDATPGAQTGVQVGVAKNVSTPSAAYKAASVPLALIRALMGGTRAMRAAGKNYLPQEPGESSDAYSNRLNRTTLFNGFRKTVRDMNGRIFNTPIVLGDDVPEQIKKHAENVDLAGRSLNVFAFDVSLDALQAGISYVLVEMPPARENATKADDIAEGRRPYFVHVKREDAIGFKSSLVAGREVLTQFRIRECVTEADPDHPFEDREITQVRVLYPGRWEIWRERQDGEKRSWAKVDEGTTTLPVIPLAPIYYNRTGFFQGEPPLMDLADLNVAHWQSQSDQRNIVHVARVPILFGAGFDESASLVIGAGTMARATLPEAKLTYVEHSGNAIGAGRDDLKDLEAQMQAMGLQLLVPTPGQTATGEIRDDVKENSPLALMAQALEDGLEHALGFMAAYEGLGEDKGGSLQVNDDFGLASLGAADMTELRGAADSGLITQETYLNEGKRRGFFDDDLDVAKEVEATTFAGQDEDSTGLNEADESDEEPLPLGRSRAPTGAADAEAEADAAA